MRGLLSWAGPGTELLVGLTDPLDPDAEPTLVPGRLELDADHRPVVRFTPPGRAVPEAAGAHRLGEDWGAVHLTESGQGWALWVFAPGSRGHLNWQIRETRRAIRRLLAGAPLPAPEASRRVTALAGELHRLVCRAELLAEPASGPTPLAERLPAA